jgi:hypothetical protein
LLFVKTGLPRGYYPAFSRAIAELEAETGGLDPEDIDEGQTTAPSKRILRYVPIYNKGITGALIVVDLGLPAIRARCPHFHQWLTTLEQLAQTPR